MKRFIHIPKNAGTSIRPWVHPMDHNDTREELPDFIKNIGLDKHLPHSKLKPNSMFDDQFAIVRNPWARMVSLYHEMFLLSDTAVMQGTPYKENWLSFISFIKKMDEFTYNEHWWCNPPSSHFANQIDWTVLNQKTDPVIDILALNEGFENDLGEYLGCQIFLGKLKKGYYDQSTWKDYYNSYTIQKVADHFKRDIDHFGFDFTTEATRNVING